MDFFLIWKIKVDRTKEVLTDEANSVMSPKIYLLQALEPC